MTPLRPNTPLSKHRSILIVGFVTLTLFVGPAAAQTGPPSGFETILTNLYDVVMLVLQYGGLIFLAVGAIVWLTARKNSDRAENGMWLLIGGGAMTIFHVGMTVFVSVLEWVATT